MKKTTMRFFPLLLFLILILVGPLTGCGKGKDFDAFTNTIFKEDVVSDSITLNYSLAHPETYDLPKLSPTLGVYSEKSRGEDLAKYENRLASLQTFDYSALTDSQKITWDSLKWLYETLLTSAEYDYYDEILGPTTGFQAQLPILLSEYNLYEKKDIEAYLLLLQDVPNYFSQLLAYEKEKSAAGLFMSDAIADQIIEQCKAFYSAKENNVLIQVFNRRINSFSWLTAKEKAFFQEENKTAVLDYVIPAYQALTEGLETLKGTGGRLLGLCSLPKGKDYYAFLIRHSTGDDRSIPEISSNLDQTIDQCISSLQTSLSQNPELLTKAAGVTYPLKDPEKILEFLKEAIQKDFPKLQKVSYTVSYVDPSLEENLSPAFYLTPPMDDWKKNSIYINGSSQYDLSSIFPTMAHEGFPGHLYQTTYFLQQNPPAIRCLYSFPGYSEGWASYVEFISYDYAGFEKELASIVRNNHIATLCMYAKIDLGVNYFGWDLKETSRYLEKFGIKSEETIEKVYTAMIAEPGGYLKYADGYLNFAHLRETMQQEHGSQYTDLAFHTYVLNTGPCPFPVLEKHMPKAGAQKQ